MSDLTPVEKRKLERALGMGTGFVLGFSNRTFAEFFLDFFGVDIYDGKYEYESGSKANRMRAFWNLESNYLVGRVIGTLFDDWQEFRGFQDPDEPPEECLQIAQRLKESSPAADLAAVVPVGDDKSLEGLARSVRDSMERGEPEAGLDRLHTFVVRYFRSLAEKRGIATPRDKPLHSVVGEYVRALRNSGEIETEMTARILKSSISVMDAFNAVRNDRSLAHDNNMLSPDEALLIFSHVTGLIRFIQAVEARSVIASPPTSELDCVFRSKPNTDSATSRTLIPLQAEH